ncbi:centrosomal protein of 44 kDa isoform 2-T2 [Polymixia lowei]
MSTGDLKGCLRKLDDLLRTIKYPRDVDYNGLSKGDPSACLPIVSFALTSFSPLLAAQLVAAGLELTGKTDLRFTDTVYKVLRDIFLYKPILSKQQFLQWGFSQRKISVICDIIDLVLQRHNKLKKPKPRHPPSWSGTTVEALLPQTDTHNTMSDRPYVVSHIRDLSPYFGKCSYETYSPDSLNLGNTQLAGRENEEKEDVPVGSRPPDPPTWNGSKPCTTTSSAVDGRISALEAQVESILSKLDRLTALETRLEKLEHRRDTYMNDGHFITLSKENWDNLLSRVLLLETKLELTSMQRESSLVSRGRGHHMITDVPTPCLSSNSSHLHDAPQEDLKDKLERLANMMKNTSSLLKSTESSI